MHHGRKEKRLSPFPLFPIAKIGALSNGKGERIGHVLIPCHIVLILNCCLPIIQKNDHPSSFNSPLKRDETCAVIPMEELTVTKFCRLLIWREYGRRTTWKKQTKRWLHWRRA